MSRKDYELPAQVVRDLKQTHYGDLHAGHVESATRIVGDLERALARALVHTNPKFNAARFLDACSLA